MWKLGDEKRPFVPLCLLLVLFCLPSISANDVTCYSSAKYHPGLQYLPKSDQCDPTGFLEGKRKVLQGGDPSLCTRKIVTDISPDFVKPDDFQYFLIGLRSMMAGCYVKQVGYNIIVSSFRPGNVEDYQQFTCCSMGNCDVHVDAMQPDDYLHPYESNDLIAADDPDFNREYTESWLEQFKAHDWQPCAANSFILITNRIIDFSVVNDSHIAFWFQQQCAGMCADMTIVLVGREEATLDTLQEYYGNISNSLYVVPNLECLYKIGGCFYPCITEGGGECLNENLDQCLAPTIPPPIVTSPPVTQLPDTSAALHIMYVFAFSDNITLQQMGAIKDNIVSPIKTYKQFVQTNPKIPVTAAFFVPSKPNTTWITELYRMQSLTFSSSDLLPVQQVDDTSDYTPKKIKAAITLYAAHQAVVKDPVQPIIILLTDFISKPFLHSYYAGLKNDLEEFSFRIYAYSKPTHAYFVDNNTVEPDRLFENDLDNLQPIPLVSEKPDDDPSTTIKPPKITELEEVLIIVGCCVVLLIFLIVGTVVYRTKFSWMDKIDRFRAKHQEAEPQPIIEDYWELSWDRLLIKSEKIGSGAYGQVYRGKVHGRPPCVEHFYTDRPHIANQFENCDVAIKMLPKYATDAARKEFMNEIELMKTIGYNDNIVNMLGCITVGQAICLVLEYCPNRDLLQYVKALKVDVNISKSMDVKINYTKEFMLFAWQIADGMRFLASKHIIHRDLAARNILIDGQKNAKISDFGLCIILDENYAPMSNNKAFISASGRLPIKWLAPEALTRHEFSSKSDVYSFGILLWEMYSFGMTPFNEIAPKELAAHLEAGNRLEKPMLCSDEMHEVMERCWQTEPEKRPNFQELLTQLTLFLERATAGYGYIELSTTEEYSKMNKLAMSKSAPAAPAPPPAEEKSVPNSPSIFRRQTRVFSRTSSASDLGRLASPKHLPNKGTSAAKIFKRNSRSSNQLKEELQKNGLDLELGMDG